MKRKHIICGIAVLLAGGGLLIARGIWRAKPHLISLDVRNAPLRQVLANVERQSGKAIRSETPLEARITLHLVDRPLSVVLDRIAEQAGAHWSTVYAVYDSKNALKALDSVLASDGKVESAGWKRVAPELSEEGGSTPEIADPLLGPGPNPDGTDAPRPMGGMMMIRRTPEGPLVMHGPNGQTEVWAPQELIVQSTLASRLGDDPHPLATAEAAQAAAQKVHGKWTTFLAFRKSMIGMGFAGPRPGQDGFDPLKGGDNGRFARLTPQQRVQQARERHSFKMETNPLGQ